jgi:hypothetical protein
VSVIERPVFFEGQILGAADLQAAVDHAAGQMARHERYLHLWGIATGLTLEAKGVTTAAGVAYVDVVIKSGVAIDGTGREIVLAEDTPLSEAMFDQANVVGGASEDDWFPVLLVGRDESGPVPSFGAAACMSGAASRKVENVTVTFDRPGKAAELDSQPLKAVSDGPGDGLWHVLVGFVQWNNTISKFKDIKDTDQGIGPRYAGVRADEVAARSGTLVLRSAPRTDAGKTAIIMDDTNGGEFRFGLQNAAGVVTPVFTVNAKGDLKTEGKITGTVTPGNFKVQSGAAMDGVVLPLPSGVTDEMVASGKAIVHVQLTPRLGGAPTPTLSDKWGGFSLECFIDDDRRLHCLVRWFKLDSTAPPTIQDLPGLCDYLLLVAVADDKGA